MLFGKRGFELVQSCNYFSSGGLQIQLNLVGMEDVRFAEWCNSCKLNENFDLVRHGLKSSKGRYHLLKENDIFIMPSKHIGEGHNIFVTEAMMFGKVIAATRQGFLDEILSEKPHISLMRCHHIVYLMCYSR